MPVDARVYEFNGLCDDDSTTEPGVARRQVTFFCFCKKKVTKEKQPRCRAPSGFPTFRKRIRPRKQLGWRRRHVSKGNVITPTSNNFRGNPRPFSKMLARQHGNSRMRRVVKKEWFEKVVRKKEKSYSAGQSGVRIRKKQKQNLPAPAQAGA
jgi:hypothetical protein